MDHEYYESEHDWDARWKAYAEDYQDMINKLNEDQFIPTDEEIEAYLAKENQRVWLEENQLKNQQNIEMTQDDLIDTMVFIKRLKENNHEDNN